MVVGPGLLAFILSILTWCSACSLCLCALSLHVCPCAPRPSVLLSSENSVAVIFWDEEEAIAGLCCGEGSLALDCLWNKFSTSFPYFISCVRLSLIFKDTCISSSWAEGILCHWVVSVFLLFPCLKFTFLKKKKKECVSLFIAFAS